MAIPGLNDMSNLAADSGFQARVASGLWQTCVSIANEPWSQNHAARKNYVAQVLNNPNNYKPFFVNVTSVSSQVANDATSSGTVALTSSNTATQALLVTDADITGAISAAFNSFISGI